MARDETTRGRDPLLDRRAYLRLAGTAAAAVAVAGASGSADAAGRDTPPVPTDERQDDEVDADGTSGSRAAPAGVSTGSSEVSR